MMRRSFRLALAFAMACAAAGCGSTDLPLPSAPQSGGSAPGTAAQPGASARVTIPSGAQNLGGAAFGPSPLVIGAGTSVTWVNGDSIAHTTTSDSGQWDSGSLAPGASFTHVFQEPGTFPYHCNIHSGMKGTIQVNASGSPGASPSPR